MTIGRQEILAGVQARLCHFCSLFSVADTKCSLTGGHGRVYTCVGWPFRAMDFFHSEDWAISQHSHSPTSCQFHPVAISGPMTYPLTWQGACLLLSKACVTTLVCCWDKANKLFIPPEETKWQALGKQLLRGKGLVQHRECLCQMWASGLQPLESHADVLFLLVQQTIPVLFPLLQQPALLYMYTSEILHGFTLPTFKACYFLMFLRSLTFKQL